MKYYINKKWMLKYFATIYNNKVTWVFIMLYKLTNCQDICKECERKQKSPYKIYKYHLFIFMEKMVMTQNQNLWQKHNAQNTHLYTQRWWIGEL